MPQEQMRVDNPIQEYVARWCPSAYSKIENPEHYFRSMMQELHEATDAALTSMTREGYPSRRDEAEDPMQMVGEYRNRTIQAREIAWQEVVLDRYPAEVTETGRRIDALTRNEAILTRMNELAEPDGHGGWMPLDHEHPVWRMQEDDSVTVTDYCMAQQQWENELRQQVVEQLTGEGNLPDEDE